MSSFFSKVFGDSGNDDRPEDQVPEKSPLPKPGHSSPFAANHGGVVNGLEANLFGKVAQTESANTGAPAAPFGQNPPPQQSSIPQPGSGQQRDGFVRPDKLPVRGITVGELSSLLPPEFLNPNALPAGQEVDLDLTSARKSLGTGRPAVMLSEIYAACPPLFARAITPDQDFEVRLPMRRVEALLGLPHMPTAQVHTIQQAQPNSYPPSEQAPQQASASPFAASAPDAAPTSPFEIVAGDEAPASQEVQAASVPLFGSASPTPPKNEAQQAEASPFAAAHQSVEPPAAPANPAPAQASGNGEIELPLGMALRFVSTEVLGFSASSVPDRMKTHIPASAVAQRNPNGSATVPLSTLVEGLDRIQQTAFTSSDLQAMVTVPADALPAPTSQPESAAKSASPFQMEPPAETAAASPFAAQPPAEPEQPGAKSPFAVEQPAAASPPQASPFEVQKQAEPDAPAAHSPFQVETPAAETPAVESPFAAFAREDAERDASAAEQPTEERKKSSAEQLDSELQEFLDANPEARSNFKAIDPLAPRTSGVPAYRGVSEDTRALRDLSARLTAFRSKVDDEGTEEEIDAQASAELGSAPPAESEPTKPLAPLHSAETAPQPRFRDLQEDAPKTEQPEAVEANREEPMVKQEASNEEVSFFTPGPVEEPAAAEAPLTQPASSESPVEQDFSVKRAGADADEPASDFLNLPGREKSPVGHEASTVDEVEPVAEKEEVAVEPPASEAPRFIGQPAATNSLSPSTFMTSPSEQSPNAPQSSPAPAASTGNDDDWSQVELKAVFGLDKGLGPQGVFDLVKGLNGVGSAAYVKNGTTRFVTEGFGDAAPVLGGLISHVRQLSNEIGVVGAQSFALQTNRGAIYFFTEGESTIAVMQKEGDLGRAEKQRLIVILRELARIC